MAPILVRYERSDFVMKISILTFHWAINYGAVLQAYALKHVLLKYSKHVDIINYKPFFLNYAPNASHNVRTYISYLIKHGINFIRFHFCGLGQKLRNYKDFRDKYIVASTQPVFYKQSDIPQQNSDFIFIGSDQVWNKQITFADTTYFGCFLKKDTCKLVSYAASIGNDKSTVDEIVFLKNGIKNIDYISVREETAKEIIADFTDKEISVTLDPTLLLSKKDWEKIAIMPNNKSYLLLYNMDNMPLTNQIVKTIAKEKKLKILEIFSGNRSLKKLYRHATCPTAGPREFLGLFANASYIVTSSFHGTAFSLIFNKQFVTVAHPTAGSRMRDLLAKLDLSERIVTNINDIPYRDIDYRKVNVKLEIERQKSIAFLENALGVCKKEKDEPN